MSSEPSHQTPIPFVVNPQRAPTGPETYQDKAFRKLKEQPLVPLGKSKQRRECLSYLKLSSPCTGVLATCGALTVAFVRQRQGRSRDFNYWLRWRIGLQAATIVAVVGGTYALGNTKQQIDARQRETGDSQKEREEFGARLAAAEQAHAEEEGIMKTRASALAVGPTRSSPAGVEGVRHIEMASARPSTTPAGMETLAKRSEKKWWNPSTW